MRFPLAVVDFEASSLSLESYPIEVGVAIAHDPATQIASWSSLIAPAPGWLTDDWAYEAQEAHGIARADLANARSAQEVAVKLNELLSALGCAWCDSGRYDGHWLQSLYRAAGIAPAFHLWDIAGLFLLDRRLKNRFAEILATTEAPHRAGPDARRVCAALIEAHSHRLAKS